MVKDIVEMHVIVHGRVQGVFFRVTTQEYAQSIGGITGTVRNVPDGTVEIIAQGARIKLDRLLDMLQVDARPGHVDRFETTYREPVEHFTDFRIAY